PCVWAVICLYRIILYGSMLRAGARYSIMISAAGLIDKNIAISVAGGKDKSYAAQRQSPATHLASAICPRAPARHGTRPVAGSASRCPALPDHRRLRP